MREYGMTYRGEVRGGVVVVEGAKLPEGTVVRVEPVESRPTKRKKRRGKDPLYAMGDLAVETGIPDLATNIDHYLYGHPKVTHDS
jgi:hypothetical protein